MNFDGIFHIRILTFSDFLGLCRDMGVDLDRISLGIPFVPVSGRLSRAGPSPTDLQCLGSMDAEEYPQGFCRLGPCVTFPVLVRGVDGVRPGQFGLGPSKTLRFEDGVSWKRLPLWKALKSRCSIKPMPSIWYL